jgi:hypothetical protein
VSARGRRMWQATSMTPHGGEDRRTVKGLPSARRSWRRACVPFWFLLLGISAQNCGRVGAVGPDQSSAEQGGSGGIRNGSDASTLSQVVSTASECASSDDCRLEQERCCADCRSPELYTAITQAEHRQHLADCSPPKCGPPDYRPGELDCGDGYDTLTAVCEGGMCTKLNLLESPFTACQRDDECHLRTGAFGCCPLCSIRAPASGDAQYYAGGLVAFSDLAGFLSRYCPGERTCSECPSSIPNEVIARCLQGHCRVVYDGSPITFPRP